MRSTRKPILVPIIVKIFGVFNYMFSKIVGKRRNVFHFQCQEVYL